MGLHRALYVNKKMFAVFGGKARPLAELDTLKQAVRRGGMSRDKYTRPFAEGRPGLL